MPSFLSGYKTYIVGWMLVLKGIVGAVFPESGVSDNPSMDIQMGLVALGLRKAIK